MNVEIERMRAVFDGWLVDGVVQGFTPGRADR